MILHQLIFVASIILFIVSYVYIRHGKKENLGFRKSIVLVLLCYVTMVGVVYMGIAGIYYGLTGDFFPETSQADILRMTAIGGTVLFLAVIYFFYTYMKGLKNGQ